MSEPPQGYISWKITLTPQWTQPNNLSRNSMNPTLNSLTAALALNLALRAKNQIVEWIKPGGTYGIGWTGKAAENLQVQSDGKTANLVEGSLTEANVAIRMGTNPQGVKFSGKGFTGSEGVPGPFFSNIYQWVADRGVNIAPYKLAKELRPRDKFGRFKKAARKRRVMNEDELRARTTFAVMKDILNKGTSVWRGAHLGSMKFDYITKYINERNFRNTQDATDAAKFGIQNIFTDYIGSKLWCGTFERSRTMPGTAGKEASSETIASLSASAAELLKGYTPD